MDSLTAGRGCSTVGFVARFSSVVCRCSRSDRSHPSPVSPTGSFVVLLTVLFQSPPSVFSLLRVSPTASPDLPSCAFWLRSVLISVVPRSVLRYSTVAPVTGFSLIVSFCTSLVQSGFFVTLRRTIVPDETDAFFPVPATDACLTPRCSSSFRLSNAVSDVPYSATSCCTVSRRSTTQL